MLLGSLGAVLLLHFGSLPPNLSWRFGYGIAAVLGIGVLLMRKYVPESPRWLLTHACVTEAEEVVGDIEKKAAGSEKLVPAEQVIRLRVRRSTPWREISGNNFSQVPRALFAWIYAHGGASIFL